MSVEERIRTVLLQFGDPVENAVYHGECRRYYTFSCVSAGADYGDDAPGHEIYLVTIHFYAPLNENITARVRDTKRALFAAGFSWPETLNNSDDNGRDIIFECEYVEGI